MICPRPHRNSVAERWIDFRSLWLNRLIKEVLFEGYILNIKSKFESKWKQLQLQGCFYLQFHLSTWAVSRLPRWGMLQCLSDSQARLCLPSVSFTARLSCTQPHQLRAECRCAHIGWVSQLPLFKSCLWKVQSSQGFGPWQSNYWNTTFLIF